MKKLLAGALAGSMSLAAGLARADGEVLSPRATGVGESLRAAATGSLATKLNPAGLALVRSYVIEASYGYTPGDKTHVQAVSICDSVTARVGACLFYNHLSSDPSEMGDRSMHEGGITMAAPLGALNLGITNRYVSYKETVVEDVPVDGSKKGFIMDAGLTYRVFSMLTLAVVGYNLVGSDAERFSRAIGGGLAVNAMPKLLLSADARYDFEHEIARYGGGLEYLLGGGTGNQGVPLRAGYVYDSGTKGSYITGGLGFVTPRLGLDAALRRQVSEGDELMIALSLRLFLPN